MSIRKCFSLLFKITVALIILNIFACGEDNPVNSGGATVQGYVRSINGTTAVANVTVNLKSVQNTTESMTTATNNVGFYQFNNVSNGDKKLIFSKGSFRDTTIITVGGGIVIVDTTRLQNIKPFAYLSGQWDNIQTIVHDSLGYNVQSITLTDINNNNNLQQYAIIFLNCGTNALSGITTSGAANLKSFMQAGNTIYSSDYAYGTVIKIYPELSGSQTGNSQNVTANVVSSDLQNYLGKNSVSIIYNLGGWYSINPSIDLNINIPFLKASYQTSAGAVNNNVIAFSRIEGQGKLIYTTFHNEANVTTDMIKILKYFIFEL